MRGNGGKPTALMSVSQYACGCVRKCVQRGGQFVAGMVVHNHLVVSMHVENSTGGVDDRNDTTRHSESQGRKSLKLPQVPGTKSDSPAGSPVARRSPE